jgi:hypothetical protein
MKMGRGRASALLAGVATACVIPAAAWGQLDPNKVGDTVNGVTKQVPHVPSQVQKQLPKPPSTPVAKAPSSQSAPKAQSPGNSGSGNSSRSSTPSASGSTSSGSAGASSSGSSGVKAHAASTGKKASAAGSKSSVSGQQQASPSEAPKSVAGVAATVRPDTGTGGDSRLPFTGYALMVIGALGVMALVGGAGLRGATRLRFARRRA